MTIAPTGQEPGQEPDTAISELQRVNAGLRQERDAALARRMSEYDERATHQAATIDVLKAMSASPGDPQPVFDLISRHARAICGGQTSSLFEYDGSLLHYRAWSWDMEITEARQAIRALFPMPPSLQTPSGRAILEKRVVHVRDVQADTGLHPNFHANVNRSQLSVPMLRDGRAIGTVSLGSITAGGFSDSQVELLKTFAEQAVIAVTSAETYRALQIRTRDLQESMEQQTATTDVLGVINANPGNLLAVFDSILEKAHRICDSTIGALVLYENGRVHAAATRGFAPEHEAVIAGGFEPTPGHTALIQGEALYHVTDLQAAATPAIMTNAVTRSLIENMAIRTVLHVPLRNNNITIGAITAYRLVARPFSEKEISLLKNFAAQAVIAMENARLLVELQDRTAALGQRNSEFGERIEQQSATIDVLKVMSSTPDDAQPVFDLITRRAQELCNGIVTALFEFDGTLVYLRSVSGIEAADRPKYLALFPMAPNTGLTAGRAILERRIVHVRDLDSDPDMNQIIRNVRWKSALSVPLLRKEEVIGAISLGAEAKGGFTDSQIELVRTFAEQAVIAIGTVATYRTLQNRTAELIRSVDELQALEEVLRAVNSSLDLNTVLSTIISRAVQLSQADEGTIYEYDETEEYFIPKAAFGMTEERVTALRDRRIRIGETPLGRSAAIRAPLHVPDLSVAQDDDGTRQLMIDGIHAVLAVPLLREDKVVGGLVIRRRTSEGFGTTVPTLLQTFASQSVLAIENARLFQEARRAREVAETTLSDLRRTQDRLVQTEKMASLGQLTAGIAHEIKNPLNFVNNFSDLSVALIAELNEAVAPEKLTVAADLRTEIDDLTATLTSNLQKIAEHGRRADSIVKNMLLHSRYGVSERRVGDVNAIAEEALNLAYHGARAETPGFNIIMERNFDPTVGSVDLYPQEIARVLVNLITNGFYATRKRAELDAGFEPTLGLGTRNLGDQVEIRIRDNGTGIPAEVRDKIFEPFFTTKPPGQGTGLGLSLSFDIVVKQHGGS